jgi:MSHA biogenesis protein MshP
MRKRLPIICAERVHRKPSGFSVISAIFLLVVLSFLGVAMVTFSTTQHQSAAMDVMGSRAYHAARAGVEWAAYQIVNGSPANCAKVFNPGDLGAGVLSPFTVTVTCTATAVSGETISNVYQVTSTAVAGGSAGMPGYVERVISTKMGL